MSSKMCVFVTPVEGYSGYCIVEQLMRGKQRQKFETVTIGVVDQNSQWARKIKELGAKMVQIEPDNPSNLQSVMQGHTHLLCPADGQNRLTRENQQETADEYVRRTRTLFEAAKDKAQIKCAVLVHGVPSEDEKDKYAKKTCEIEKHFKERGWERWCVMRRVPSQEQIVWFAEGVGRERKLQLPLKQDASWAPVNFRDVGHAAAKVLVDLYENGSERHEQIYTLTGPTKITPKHITDALSRILGTQIEYKEISCEQAEKMLERFRQRGEMTEFYCHLLLDKFNMINRGKLSFTTNDVQKITNQQPQKIEEFLEENSGRFRV